MLGRNLPNKHPIQDVGGGGCSILLVVFCYGNPIYALAIVRNLLIYHYLVITNTS